MATQLTAPIEVLTPLGEGICYFLSNDGAVEWQVFIKRTGESWWFRNKFIRLINCTTADVGPPSPWTKLPRLLDKHIERYKANGWL